VIVTYFLGHPVIGFVCTRNGFLDSNIEVELLVANNMIKETEFIDTQKKINVTYTPYTIGGLKCQM